jgi:DNA-directed RNA polymerase II subunit RPB1
MFHKRSSIEVSESVPDTPLYECTGLRFSLLTNKDIEHDTAVTVSSNSLFAGRDPIDGGLCDSNLGTIDVTYDCKSCHHSLGKCMGHSGDIDLVYPVINPILIGETVKIMKNHCPNCGLFHKIATGKNKTIQCTECMATIPHSFQKDDEQSHIIRHNKTPTKMERTRMDPYDVRGILDKIHARTPLKIPPDAMVLTRLVVPSVVLRPDIRLMSSESKASSDDITRNLKEITAKNLTLTLTDGKLSKESQANYDLMVIYIRTFMIGSQTTDTYVGRGSQKTAIVGNSLGSMITGKAQLLRSKTVGKRINKCARTVISGNPKIAIDEFGVPIQIAKTILVEEIIQAFNFDRLNSYFQNGKIGRYPAVKQYKKGKKVYKLSKETTDTLNIGDIVFRDVIEGDQALFNRIPSLYPSSILLHRIRIIHDSEIKTFQMNVTSCAWYAADFDGDEMNCYFLSSTQAKVEAELLSVPAIWYKSAQFSKPHVGQVQDSVVGSYYMTRKSTTGISKATAMQFFANTSKKPDFSGYTDTHPFSGSEIISKWLPRVLNHHQRCKSYDETFVDMRDTPTEEQFLKIVNGQLISGVLDKASVGTGDVGIFPSIMNHVGTKKTIDYIYDLQQIVLAHNQAYGVSVGISDLLPGKKVQDMVKTQLSELITDYNFMVSDWLQNRIVPPAGLTVTEFLEKQLMFKLQSDFREAMTEVVRKPNGLFDLFITGSKGVWMNILHMMSCLGQQTLFGGRIPNDLSYQKATPHFPRCALSPIPRGFITSSYGDGLAIDELDILARVTRDDTIKKTLSTSISGEFARILAKNMETSIIENNKFCSNDSTILSFAFGGDGFDPRFIQKVKIPTIMISDETFDRIYDCAGFEEHIDIIRKDRSRYRNILMSIEKLDIQGSFNDNMYVPIDVKQLIFDTKLEILHIKDECSDVDAIDTLPEESIEIQKKNSSLVLDFCEHIGYMYMNRNAKDKKLPLHDFQSASLTFLVVYLRSMLHPNAIAPFNTKVVKFILEKIHLSIKEAFVWSGLPIGLISAMCLSEQFTQASLNSIHLSSAELSIQKTGLSFGKEVTACAKVSRMENPMMIIPFKKGVTAEKAQYVAKYIEDLKLGLFITSADLFLEEYGQIRHPKFKKDSLFIKQHESFLGYSRPTDLLSWCVRLELDKLGMLLKHITVSEMANKLNENQYVYAIPSNGNDSEVVLRIYLREGSKTNTINGAKLFMRNLYGFSIHGIPDIAAASVVTSQIKHHIGDDGSVQSYNPMFMVTRGSNLMAILELQPYITEIDYLGIRSDVIPEMFELFGIEAARRTILTLYKSLLTINMRHFMLLAELLTFRGIPMGIARGSHRKSRQNMLLKMVIGAPTKTVVDEAIKNTHVPLRGLTSTLFAGIPPKIGTNFSPMVVNMDIIRKHTKDEKQDIKDLMGL